MKTNNSKVVVNFNALLHNLKTIEKKIDLEKVIAVVKADAYGHGLVKISEFLLRNKVKKLGVARIEEAIEISNSCSFQLGVDYEILIMGYTSNDNLKEYACSGFTFTVTDFAQALILNEYPNKIHFKTNTGFNRLGKRIDSSLVNEILAVNDLENITLEACFSHLRLVNDRDDKKQFEQLKFLKDELSKVNPSIKYHINDSVGFLRHPDFNLDYVRIGALLYGLIPNSQKNLMDVKPVMSVYSFVSNITEIKKGEGIGYSEDIVKEDLTVATIPVGYGDGYKRIFSSNGYVIINGKKCNIVSLICMDQMMVDITNKDVKMYDKVDILSEKITADTLASLAKTNKNDIVCNFSIRLSKEYMER